MTFTTRASVAALAAAGVLAAGAANAQTRDRIQIVGSSTVFPYTQAVSEQFANATQFQAPVVESTGTGGGMKIFCEGIGAGTPDITGASRKMKQSEYELCTQNGVESVTEVQIGFDGLTMAYSNQAEADYDLSKEQVFRALAAQLPDDSGAMVDNPNANWSDIDPSLPDVAIQVFGPPPTSGTRDAFVELVMDAGCEAIPAIEAMEGEAKAQACGTLRTDGAFIEAGENDNLIVQRLESDPTTLGIFGYSFFYENQDQLKAAAIEGVEPSEETIADGSYPVSRPLFFYVKNAHRDVIPGLNEFVEMYTSEDAIGEGGYLSERGLTPLDEGKRDELRTAVSEGANNVGY